MVADMSAAGMERLAEEFDSFSFLYWRRNSRGVIVRDAKFIDDAGNYEIAVGLFADYVGGLRADVEIGLCAVLRGRVDTVDDIDRADQPVMDYAAHERLEILNSQANLGNADTFSVYGSWDTGDGHKRYMKVVQAQDPLHAELIVRADKTEGEFLVAAVVEGCVPTEDTEEWATVNGQQTALAAPKRPWWKVWG